eukprot:gene27108-35827_t
MSAFALATAGTDDTIVLNISVWFPSMIGRPKPAHVLVPEYYLRNDQLLIKHCEPLSCTWRLSERLLLQIQAVAPLVVNQRSPMINCNSGIGLFMLGMWHYTSGVAQSHVLNIVSTQSVTPLTKVMTDNVATNGYWAQSLLISSSTCELFHESRAVNLHYSKTALQELVTMPSSSSAVGAYSISFLVEQMIANECPALIHISSYHSLTDWSVCSLFGAADLLSRCGSPVYLETPPSSASSSQITEEDRLLQMAIAFLRSQHYSLFQQLQGRATIGLLALPKDRAVEYLRILAAMDSTPTFLSEEDWSEPQQSESESESGEGEGGEPATLRLVDLTVESSVNLTSLPESLRTLTLTWPLATPPYSAIHEGIESEAEKDEWVDKDGQRIAILRAVSLRCSLWISQVIAALVRPEKMTMMSSQRELWTNECSHFLQRRLLLLHNLTSQHREVISDGGLVVGDRLYLPYDTAVSPPSPSPSQEEEGEEDRLPLVLREPFRFELQDDVCGEPIFCGHTRVFQRRLLAWQYPDLAASAPSRIRQWPRRSCDTAKFLVFEPPSENHGLGSMLEVVAAAFRKAICLDRILVLQPLVTLQALAMLKWLHPGCRGNVFECYFQPISGCVVTAEEIERAKQLNHTSTNGDFFDAYPLRDERVLLLHGLPVSDPCGLCMDQWPMNGHFFDGLFVMGVSKPIPPEEAVHASEDSEPGHHYRAFMESSRQVWIGQFLRFLMRPRPWLTQTLQQAVKLSMVSPAIDGHGDRLSWSSFPTSFLSMHVRFGMKAMEVDLHPLNRYMTIAQRKVPYIRDVFVSTETEAVIETLVREYPSYRFHFLKYRRLEFLDLGLRFPDHYQRTDYVYEMLMSLANLYVAVEADGFVGSLSSNWCAMIMHLERTRGDGGFDYHSVDSGSAFTSCF